MTEFWYNMVASVYLTAIGPFLVLIVYRMYTVVKEGVQETQRLLKEFREEQEKIDNYKKQQDENSNIN